MRRTVLASLAPVMMAIALPAASQAADLPLRRAHPPAPVLATAAPTWSGVYAGAQAGYVWGHDITREYLTFPWTFVGLQNRFEPKGWVGGVHLGANMQLGSIIVGAEVDGELGRVTGGFVDPPAPPFNPGGRGRTEIDAQGSLRARLGYAFGPVLLYGTGGIAIAQIKSTYWNWPGTSEKFTRMIPGYTYGGGVEFMLTNNITMRAEYRYANFRLHKNNSVVAFPGFTGTQEPFYHTVRVGASYRF